VESYHLDDDGGMLSEMLDPTRTTLCNTPGDTPHCCCHEHIPEDGVLQPYTVSLYGEVNQQWLHGNTTAVSYHPENGGDVLQNIESIKSHMV
jgi:hypothetical protein